MSEENELSTLRAEYSRIARITSEMNRAIIAHRADLKGFEACVGADPNEDVEINILIGWSEQVLAEAEAVEAELCLRQVKVLDRTAEIERKMRIERLVKSHAASMKGLVAALEAAKV